MDGSLTETSHLFPQEGGGREKEREERDESFETSKPTLNDTLSLTSPHAQSLPNSPINW